MKHDLDARDKEIDDLKNDADKIRKDYQERFASETSQLREELNTKDKKIGELKAVAAAVATGVAGSGAGVVAGKQLSTNDSNSANDKNEANDERKEIVENLKAELQAKDKLIEELNAKADSELSRGILESSSPINTTAGPTSNAINERDYNAVKRENIELNSELIKLKANNETLSQKFNEFEPLMNNSIIELEKLNNIIQHQQDEIAELTQQAAKSEQHLEEINKLQTENDILHKQLENLKRERAGKRTSTNDKISNISTDINKLVALWRTKKEAASDLDRSLITDESINESSNDEDFANRSVISSVSSVSNNKAFNQLHSQINEMIHINKEQENKNIALQEKIIELTTEMATLKEQSVKANDFEKLEENYRNAMNSMKKTGKALDMSQKELNKQKEQNNTLKSEIEELKLYRASRKNNSRNSVENGNNSGSIGENIANGDGFDEDDEDEDDMKNAHYNFKIKDLEAELFIIKQERDELKENVVSLRKKLINSAK